MNIITGTIWGAKLQTALLLGRQHQVDPKTSLNEKFDILAEQPYPDDRNPALGYMTIGDRGHQIATGSDGVSFTDPVNHRCKDGALYHHMPFVLREPDDDLTVDQRRRYRLRKRVTFNGITYIAYYAKVLDLSNVAISLQYLTQLNGETTEQPFEPTDDVLAPEPPAISSEGVISTSGDMLSVSAICEASFTQNDVREYINVARIMFDNESRALVSEIGFVTGMDTIATAEDDQGRFNYEEVIGAQIMSFVTGYYGVGANNQGFNLQVQAGSAEPMIGEKVSVDG